jgi:hypothetical protein
MHGPVRWLGARGRADEAGHQGDQDGETVRFQWMSCLKMQWLQGSAAHGAALCGNEPSHG